MTGSPARIARLEHVNLTIPDQQVATLFYVVGLGLTRDPALMVGLNNMWVNAGRSQFHLPTSPRGPQKLRGEIRLTLPDLDRAAQSLAMVAPQLAGTAFGWTRDAAGIDVTCPWVNRIRLVPPGDRADATELGIKSGGLRRAGVNGGRHRRLLRGIVRHGIRSRRGGRQPGGHRPLRSRPAPGVP